MAASDLMPAVGGWTLGLLTPAAAIGGITAALTGATAGPSFADLIIAFVAAGLTSPLGLFGAACAFEVRDRRAAEWGGRATAFGGGYAAALVTWAGLVVLWVWAAAS